MAITCPEYIIYKATNLINAKLYIGQTVQGLNRRKMRHIRRAMNNDIHFAFHRAIKKYGAENFTFEILHHCLSKEEMDRKERESIKELNTKIPHGYNLTDGGGGNLGRKRTAEERAKISASLIGNKRTLGHKASLETRAKISAAHLGNKFRLGRKLNAEHREKIRESLKGNKHRLGDVASPETRLKMSLVHVGRKHTDESREKMKTSWVIRKQKSISMGGTGYGYSR